MADISAVVIPIVQPLINRLGNEVYNELELLCCLESDLKTLKDTLVTIMEVLEDAESRSTAEQALRRWLTDIKDVAYDADDVVDEFRTEALRRKILQSPKIREFFSNILFRHNMGHKTRNVLTSIGRLLKKKNDFNLRETNVENNALIPDPRETWADVDESHVYGRDDDRDAIVDLLVNRGLEEKLSVIPIVGLGGLGKTTLAQFVLKDRRLGMFDFVPWVYVGEKFVLKSIIAAIVKCGDSSSLTLDHMRQRLQNEVEGVKGKKFLLVLDDVWDEGNKALETLASKWGKLRDILLNAGEPGSKIIVTTRSDAVADTMRTMEPYRPKGLSPEVSWKLFREKAFARKVTETKELEEIGMEIVCNCQGIPLAVKAIGNAMSKIENKEGWLKVQKSEIWKLPHNRDNPDNPDEILPALQISYDHLPPYLKQCFTYSAIYPKDYEINRLKLIQLWIAGGFINISEGEIEEDIGQQYFNSLQQQLFFQYEMKNEFAQTSSCKMYDLMQELACYIAKDEFFIKDVEATDNHDIVECSIAKNRSLFEDGGSMKSYRHSAIILDVKNCNIGRFILSVGDEAKKLRSLHLLSKRKSNANAVVMEKFELGFDSTLTRLRVLDLSDVDMLSFPEFVGKLKHLRFLGFLSTSVSELPGSIASLYNLQILILKGCAELVELPKGLANLKFLRHLNISGCEKLTDMPSRLGELTSLRTLPLFVVGEKPGRIISELQNLNHIRGELKVSCLQNLGQEEAKSAKLSDKPNIQSLELSWSVRYGDRLRGNDIEVAVLENLQPHQNLEHLTIKGYDGKNFPSWLSSQICKLKKLVLVSLRRCEDISPLGQLPSLEHLQLQKISSLIRIEFNQDDAIFPSLKFLELIELDNLEAWVVPRVKDIFPSLEKLHISSCSKLEVTSHLPSAVTELVIDESSEKLLGAGENLKGLTRLGSLMIKRMQASISGRWEGLQYVTTLQKLEIDSCRMLSSLPDDVLHLPSLQSLKLSNNINMKTLAKAVVNRQREDWPLFCTSLHQLTINNFAALATLPQWVGRLTSLRSLEIRECPSLERLPNGLEHLGSLIQLTIYSCPHLKQRCQKGGDDWDKIKHVRNIMVDTTSFLEVSPVIRQ